MAQAQQAFSKLQFVASLFAKTIGDDLYYARQIKESIEAALPQPLRDDPEAFVRAAEQLAQHAGDHPTPVSLVRAQDDPAFSLLCLRARLLEALKSNCRFDNPILVLTGLREAICPPQTRWTPRRKIEYQEAISYARDFCHARSRPSSKLSLVIL